MSMTCLECNRNFKARVVQGEDEAEDGTIVCVSVTQCPHCHVVYVLSAEAVIRPKNR
jgi:hypothetical protein